MIEVKTNRVLVFVGWCGSGDLGSRAREIAQICIPLQASCVFECSLVHNESKLRIETYLEVSVIFFGKHGTVLISFGRHAPSFVMNMYNLSY